MTHTDVPLPHVHLSARRLHGLLGEWDAGGSVYRALAERIELLVIDGRIPAGTRLPSERELAVELSRSRSTIVAAYDVLRRTGHLTSRQGSGSVATLPRSSPDGFEVAAIDFAHAAPEPIPGLAEIMRSAMGRIEHALGNPVFDMLGDLELRERIADRYTRRGLPTSASQVMVTMGAQHAIALLAQAFVQRSDRVLLETPSYPHAHDAFKAAGAQLVTTPVTREGWDPDHLFAMLERSRPALTYVMPDFQNPTGASMPPDVRDRVVAACARVRSVLVVDETTADLDISRGWDDGPMAAYSAARGTTVVTTGSLSKSMWGGLRIGWIRAESSVLDVLVRTRPSFDLGTPQLEQLVASELVARLPELLRLRRRQLTDSRDFLVSQLERLLPEWDVPSVDGGLSLWVGLGRPLSSSLALMSSARGLLISAGPKFAIDGSQERFLRLPFTTSPEDLAGGVRVLAETWASLAPLTTPLAPPQAPAVV